jgi:hypothetical protein
MKKYSCPSCGAEIEFQSSASIFTVCKFCQSTLIRKDLNLESIGKMAALKDDLTPFQIGTSGKYQGNFSIIGRVRVSWSSGFWNEWFVRFDDGREGWLAEAQGFYMMSFPVETPADLPLVGDLKPETTVKIAKTIYQVDDVKDVTYTFAEGELPFAAPMGFKGVSVDLVQGEQQFASISYGSGGDTDVFVGSYLEFDEFHFQNLRQIDGW